MNDDAAVNRTLNDLHLMVGRIEGKVDGMSDALTGYGKRIGSLEKSRAYSLGVAGLATVLWAGVVAFVPSMLDALKSFIKGA